MLSVFPDLLNFGLFAPFILRLALGFFVGFLAVSRLKKSGRGASGREMFGGATVGADGEEGTIAKTQISEQRSQAYGILEIIVAVFLIVGLLTQVAALISIFLLLLERQARKSGGREWNLEKSAFVLAVVIAFSLLFIGAGFFAFDLPL